jgi:hypothetical protein
LPLLPALPSLAASKIHPRAGTTAAAFLKIDPSPRAAALGGAYSAVSGGAYATYWNPAGLAQLTRPEASLMYNRYFSDMRQEFVGLAAPVSERWALGAHFDALDVRRDLERRSGTGEEDPTAALTSSEGDFGARDMAGTLSAARRFGRGFSLGASLKILQQRIDTLRETGFAADAGFLWRSPGRFLSIGGGLRNLGPSLRFLQKSYPLPLSYHLGAAARWGKDRLLVSAGLEQPIDNYLFSGAGVEFRPLSFVAVRTGYRFRLHGNELGAFSGFRTGAGLLLPPFQLDYAFVPMGDFESTHRVSLGMRFGREIGAEKTREATPEKTAAPPNPSEEAVDVWTLLPVSPSVKVLRIGPRQSTYEVLLSADADAGVRRIVFRSNSSDLPRSGLFLEEKDTVRQPPKGAFAGFKVYRIASDALRPEGPVGVAFRIPKSWLKERAVAAERVSLYVWDGQEYRPQPTRIVGQDELYYKFRADAALDGRWLLGGYAEE